MVNLDPVNPPQNLPLSFSLRENIHQLVEMVMAIRNLPLPLLSNAISATVPGVTRGFAFINQQWGKFASLLHHPPCFDDVLNVADADKLWGDETHKELLGLLYVVDCDRTSQTTPQALGELFRTLLSGFVAEPLPINRQVCQKLSLALRPYIKKSGIPAEVLARRIEQYLLHRYLLCFPEVQTFINLPMVLSLCKSYLPLPPLLQQLLTSDPLTLIYSILTMEYVTPASPPIQSLAIWNQTRYDNWHCRPPVSFLAGYTAQTLNTEAQCLPGSDLPRNHCYSFVRPLHHSEVPQCLTNQTHTGLPYGTQVNAFTATDSSGNVHSVIQVEVGHAALRVRDISTVARSQLLHLTPSNTLGDGIGQIVATPATHNALAQRHSPDTHVGNVANAATDLWQKFVTLLDVNFPPGVQGEEIQQLYAQHQGQIFVSPRPTPAMNTGIPLVENFIPRMQRKFNLLPRVEGLKVWVMFKYEDGSQGEQQQLLTNALTDFRDQEFAVVYPLAWYRHHPAAIAEFEKYRGHNYTHADRLAVRLQNADFQRLKRKDLWPTRWEVHAADFVLALTATFKFSEKLVAKVRFIDADDERTMTLVKVITTLPDIIEMIKWPAEIPVAATDLLERYRRTTSVVMRKNLLLEIALNKPAVEQGFPPFHLREVVDELRSLTQSDALADLDMAAMAAVWVDDQLNDHYDASEQRNGLLIPSSRRLTAASRVMARIFYRSGADGTETLVNTQRISLARLAYGELQTQYDMNNHRVEVTVPPALKTAFSLDNPFPAPGFAITGQIYVKMSGNTQRCRASETCYNAIAEMQRRLIHYRLARHLAVLNQRQPKSGSDHIEQQQLTDLLQLADSRPLLHLVKFDGQPLATFFALRGAGHWLLFSTEYDGVITLHENQQTHLTKNEANQIYRALPLQYSMQHVNNKAQLNIILATGADAQGRLGLYDFVLPTREPLHHQLTDAIFTHNFADIEALFRTPADIWATFARSFPNDTFTGMTTVLEHFAMKSLSSVARTLTAITELVNNDPQWGMAYSLAKLTEEPQSRLALDVVTGTGFDFTGFATRRYDLIPWVDNLLSRGRALQQSIADMQAKKQTSKILAALEEGKLQAELPAGQLRVPFANPWLKLHYARYNNHIVNRESVPNILATGRRHARELLRGAIKTLSAKQFRPLVKRLMQLFFAKNDHVFIQEFIRQLRQMKRDLNRLNVRTQIDLDDDEQAIMAVDMVNYQRFRQNYIAIENGASEVERFSETIFNVATHTLLADLNNCAGHVIDCAAMRFIDLFNQGVKKTLNYAVASGVPGRKGVRDFSALTDLNEPDYIVPVAFRGQDAQFLAENRRGQVNGQTTGSRNTDSHSWVIYFLASMADNGLVEEAISKLEGSRQTPPE